MSDHRYTEENGRRLLESQHNTRDSERVNPMRHHNDALENARRKVLELEKQFKAKQEQLNTNPYMYLAEKDKVFSNALESYPRFRDYPGPSINTEAVESYRQEEEYHKNNVRKTGSELDTALERASKECAPLIAQFDALPSEPKQQTDAGRAAVDCIRGTATEATADTPMPPTYNTRSSPDLGNAR